MGVVDATLIWPVSMPPCRTVSVSTSAWQRQRRGEECGAVEPTNGDFNSKHCSLSSKSGDLSIKDCLLIMDSSIL